MKILLMIALAHAMSMSHAQKYYKRIPISKLNSERKIIATQFATDYIEKCNSKDYKPFTNYNISVKMNSILRATFKRNCQKFEEQFGKMILLELESAYLQKFSQDKDPIDLLIFPISTEKDSPKMYLNLWIYHDQNYISGLIISERKYYETLKKEKSQE